jgi:hypothetical protein
VDTEIPFHEDKLFKEEEERKVNTFTDIFPCSIQVDLDLQVIQKVLQYNEQQQRNTLPTLPRLAS